MFERFDANGDGRLTGDELPERARDRMMESDANGDGALTKDELQQAREGMMRGEGHERRSFGDPAAMFERFDANGDGSLTADEMPERARERMMGADMNGDGAVTQEEFAKSHQSRGGRRGPDRGQ